MIAKIKNFGPLAFPLRLCERYLSAPRAENDYATHVPILLGLARMREIKSVLEFGCGRYSTLTFLNRAAFPHLEQLHSIENDSAWSEAINKLARDDDRWTLQLISGPIAEAVSDVDVERFDLILIDDSKTSEERAATICAVAKKRPQRPWIAIHDFEIEEYQQAASAFRRRYKFRAYTPKTGLISNSAVKTRRFKRLLKSNARILPPDDIQAWLHRLNHV